MNLIINGLDFSYRRKTPVLKQTNLSANSGEIIALLGGNGSGKTSLINIIAGLLTPDSGRCEVGSHLSIHHDLPIVEDMFYLNEEGLLSMVTTPYAITASTFYRANRGFYSRFNKALYKRLCHDLQVNDSQTIQSMSMGHRKKFFMAFGLATEARILLLDEPLNGLDIVAKKILRHHISNVATQKDGLVFISTHQVREINGWVNSIAVLHQHHIVFHQNVEQIAKNLKYSRHTKETVPEDKIYSMPLIDDTVAVLQANNDDEQVAGPIDYEIIFHAAVNFPDALNQVFNK